jgi:hypothetical protein
VAVFSALWCDDGDLRNPQAMARFDSNARFDEHLTYDSGSGPASWVPILQTKSKKMNRFKLELRTKTVPEKLQMGQNHITSMDGNTNYPTATRVPSDAAFQAAQDDLAAAEAAGLETEDPGAGCEDGGLGRRRDRPREQLRGGDAE